MCFGGGVYGAAGYLFGAQVVEASVIAEDPSHVDYQIAMLQNYRPTVLITTPTNAFELIQVMERRRLDPQSLHVRTVLLSRPVDKETREQLAAGLFAKVQCNFGIREVFDPGLCVECEAGQFHVHEDHLLVEIQEGELVLTTLCREAMPLLRYRTRVACAMSHEKCSCGRTGVVLRPGPRLDRCLLVNETPLYESQIAEVLTRTAVAGRPFQATISDRHVVITLEMSAALFSDTIWYLERLQHEVESECSARLGVEVRVQFTQPSYKA